MEPEGAEGEWAGGPSPLPPFGQLTRCFSAVAELLVAVGDDKKKGRKGGKGTQSHK